MNAVHLWGKLDSPVSTSSTSFTPILTVSAADLVEAGFEENDDLLFIWYFMGGTTSVSGIRHSATYGTTLMPGSYHRADFLLGRESAFMGMDRKVFAASTDFVLSHASSNNSYEGTTHHASVLIIRMADFGKENVDWFWNRSISIIQNTTVYMNEKGDPFPDIRAKIVWTPDEVEDWVYLSYVHSAVDSNAVNFEARVTLDDIVDSGGWSKEGRTTLEELAVMWPGYLPSLATGEHVLQVETRDDATSATPNDHRRSVLFVFKKQRWSDLFVEEPGIVSVSPSVSLLSSVTDTLSEAQPLVLFGWGRLNINSSGQSLYLWGTEGSTAIDPSVDLGSGLSTQTSWDDTDDSPLSWFAYRDSVSGTLDFELHAAHTVIGWRSLNDGRFLVWGLKKRPILINAIISTENVDELDSGLKDLNLDSGANQDDIVSTARMGPIESTVEGAE